MAINFDSLPDSAGSGVLIPKGTYYAVIEKAEMRESKKDPSKPPYLSLQYAIKNAAGKSFGKLFDIITESEANLSRYKLKRFIQALGLNITGSFELKDLTKVCVGKTILVDIKTEQQEGYPERSVIDGTSGKVFYPVSEASVVFGGADAETDTKFIQAQENADAPFTVDTADSSNY